MSPTTYNNTDIEQSIVRLSLENNETIKIEIVLRSKNIKDNREVEFWVNQKFNKELENDIINEIREKGSFSKKISIDNKKKIYEQIDNLINIIKTSK